MKTVIKVAVVAVLACAFASSCEKLEKGGRVSRPIRINVTNVNTDVTKALVTNTHGLEVLGGFMLNAYVEDEYYDYTVSPAVKVGDAGSYLEPDDQDTPNVHFHTGVWTIDNNKNWVANITTRFYCHAPADMNCADGCTPAVRSNIVHKWNVSGHEKEMSFSYAMAAAGQSNPITHYCHDADNCNDLLFAYADKVYDGDSETIDLTFYHALSRVTFIVSPNDDTFDNTLEIKTITITSIPRSGNCTFIPSATNVEDKFVWSGLGAGASYTQSYDATFLTKPEGWTESGYTRDSHTYALWAADNSFFFIPHTLSSAQVTIVFVDNGTEIPRTTTLPADTWEAGKYYKYKIGATVLGREIKVDVTLDDWTNYDDKLII